MEVGRLECFWSFGALCPKSTPGPWSVDSSLPIFHFPGPVPAPPQRAPASGLHVSWWRCEALPQPVDWRLAVCAGTGAPVAWPGGAQTILWLQCCRPLRSPGQSFLGLCCCPSSTSCVRGCRDQSSRGELYLQVPLSLTFIVTCGCKHVLSISPNF